MNAEAPNDFREQAEARIVALLLGEASPFEEAAVQDLIKRDPGLSAYYEEMKKVLSLVQAASGGGGAKDPVTSPPQLSPARREALRQIIGKPAMVAAPIIPLPLWRRRWFMPAAIAASLAGLLGLSIWFNGDGRQGLRSLTMAKSKGYSTHPTVERIAESDAELPAAPKGAPSGAYLFNMRSRPSSQSLFEFRPTEHSQISGQKTPSAPRAIEEKARAGLTEDKSAQSSPVTLGLRSFYDAKPEGKTAAAKPDGQTAEAKPATAAPSVFAGVALDSKATAEEETVVRPAMPIEMLRRYGMIPRPAQPEAEARFAGESSVSQSVRPAPAAAPPPAAVERYVERLQEAVNPNPIRLGDGSVVSEVSPIQIRLNEMSVVSSGVGGGGISDRKRDRISDRISNGIDDNESLGLVSKDGHAGAAGTPSYEARRALVQDGSAEGQAVLNTPPSAGAQPQGGRVVFDISESAKNNPAGAPSQSAANQLAFGDAISLAGVPKRDIEKPDLFLSPTASADAPLQAGYGALQTAQLGKGKLSAKGRVADAIAVLEKKPEEMAKKLESPAQLSQNSWAYVPPTVSSTVTQGVPRDSFGVTDVEKYQPEKPDADPVPLLGDIPELGALFRSSKPAKDELAAGNFRYSFVPARKVTHLQSAPESQPAEALKEEDRAAKTPKPLPPTPPPEVDTRENAVSTFSLNVSDVSFRLAATSVEKGAWPDPAGIRTEEFVNAFDYRDPLPAGGARVGFAWEHARYPFAHNRDVVRLALRTAAAGREPGRPLNLVVVLDHSGSMERADRVAIVQEAMRVLSGQLQPADRISVILFARTAQLWVDGLAGDQSGELAERMRTLNPQGGTNLEEALALAYATALRHFLASGNNRVILMTDGAANLGEVQADILERQVTEHRKKGIALDCFGIGWEGLNDDLLEVLSRHGDGRYGFLNSVEAVKSDFARQLTGALEVAAMDVKAQVEFNPQRVTTFRQVGYARHQLTQEQFRDNTVDAAELGAAEAGNALYVIQTNPQGQGPLGVVRVRFKVPATGEYLEQSWELPFQPRVPALDQAAPTLRLAATAAACADWLANSPYAAEVTPDALESLLRGVPEAFAPDPRPQTLVNLIRQARSLGAK